MCENRPGSYTCKCSVGYEKSTPDSRLCKLVGERTEGFLLFSNNYYIRNISLTSNNYNLVKDGFSGATGISYDYNQSYIYVADAVGNKIYRLKQHNSTTVSNLETIITDQVGSVGGIAIDWIGKKLYYLLTTQLKLMVSDLNGYYRSTLLDYKVLQEPMSIAVDPSEGYIFFTDWKYPAYIGRVGMDGKNFTKIITTDIGSPIGLTLDIITKRVFWSDTHLKRIEFCNYDGKGRYMPISTDQTVFPFAIAFYDGLIYWSDRSTDSLFSADALNGSNKIVLREGTIHSVSYMTVYHYSLQRKRENPCGSNNGGCSHLCLLSASALNFTCSCPDNFLLSADNKTCQANCNSAQFRCGQPDERCVPFYWKCGKYCFVAFLFI
jgi:low density lipoprotein-related protein 2